MKRWIISRSSLRYAEELAGIKRAKPLIDLGLLEDDLLIYPGYVTTIGLL